MAVEKRSVSNFDLSPTRPEKLTLVSVLLLAGLLVITVLAILFFVPYYGLNHIHPWLPTLMAIATLVLAGITVFVLVLFIAATVLGRDVPFSRKLRSLAIKGLLPVLVLLGKLIGLRREQVQHAFVAVNNELVLSQCRNGHPPRRILLLMPHCLQDKDCPVKVTHTVENCKRCGKCSIKGLLELSSKFGVDLAVATGGTIARRIVIETRPDLIIAVACERDLTSGIQDTSPLPVYGIFNKRPFGPCLNTQVAIDHVQLVLEEIASLQRKSV